MLKIKKNGVILGCAAAIICETIFGMSYAFTKQATQQASEFYLLGWRFIVAAAVMSILWALGAVKMNFRGKKLKPVIIASLFSPILYFIGETLGISKTTAIESGILLASIPVASVIASSIFLKKKPQKLQMAGILITLAGVIITVLASGLQASLSLVGYACLLLAVLSFVCYSIFVEKASAFTSIEITYITILAGALFFGITAISKAAFSGEMQLLINLPFINAEFLTAVLYAGICCSIIAYFLLNFAIAKIGINSTSSFIGVATVVSILSGMIISGEQASLIKIAGAAIIIIGVYIANHRKKAL